MDVHGVYSWHGARSSLERVSHLRGDRKLSYASTALFHRDPHLIGVVGEWLLSYLTGQELNEEELVGGDGGLDFPGADVKTVTYWESPILKLLEKDIVGPAVYFPLVAVDEPRELVRYVGFGSKELACGSDVGYEREFGYGSRWCVDGEDLMRGLWPGARGTA